MKKLLFILLLGLGFSQTEWTTRVYNIDLNIDSGEEFPLDMLSMTNNEQDFIIQFGGGTETIKLLVTAEFPEEDTGYIEDGFEFCVSPGANLLSFPCDNSINISESLPTGIENFITSIIGQGEATTYNPALGWVGSLAEFTPGSGYWFKSNSSLCFEYECVDN